MPPEQRQHFLEGAIRRGMGADNPLEVGCGSQDVGKDVARRGTSSVGDQGWECAFVEEECNVRLSCASEGLAEAPLCRGRESMVVAQQPWGHPDEEHRPDISTARGILKNRKRWEKSGVRKELAITRFGPCKDP
jgi:hypothetical protein